MCAYPFSLLCAHAPTYTHTHCSACISLVIDAELAPRLPSFLFIDIRARCMVSLSVSLGPLHRRYWLIAYAGS